MKILIVDDNTSITSSLGKYLEILGYDVSTCNDAYDGLELIQNDQWDKILLDLSMPELSGLDIIEDLEKNNMLKDKNIVLFTSCSIPDNVLDKLLEKDGIETCLKKPVSLKKVVQTISA